MNKEDVLKHFLNAFTAYYNIEEENVTPPFAAEAKFHTHDEGYWLVKSAKLSEAESDEYVFFALCEDLTMEAYRDFDEKAWEEGLKRTKPFNGMQNSDVTLIIIADRIDKAVKKKAAAVNHFKSYKFGLYGMSHFRLVALELSTEAVIYNRQGSNLKKLVNNILSHAKASIK